MDILNASCTESDQDFTIEVDVFQVVEGGYIQVTEAEVMEELNALFELELILTKEMDEQLDPLGLNDLEMVAI